MSSRLALITVIGLSAAANTLWFGGAQAAESSRPNIVVIMPDDQGYGDQGVTGNRVIRTPNIDALAQDSASMSDFYVCPVCSPTRASTLR